MKTDLSDTGPYATKEDSHTAGELEISVAQLRQHRAGEDTPPMKETYLQTAARQYAEALKAAAPDGVYVYLAEKGTYGFFTNGKRVVSFSADLGGLTLSGNYRPSSASGTGWRMCDNAPAPTMHNIEQSLSAGAPSWANKEPVYTTEAQYLETYQSSSKFTKI